MSNYRPVSLNRIVVKLLEKIIRAELPSHIELYNLLTTEQHRFRNKHSCLTNLLITRVLDNGPR